MRHELHVTIPPDEFGRVREMRVRGVRWHLFHNYCADGHVVVDCMSSEEVQGNDDAAMLALEMRVKMLESSGFSVLRAKIEAEPWRTGKTMYLETHMRVVGGVYGVLPHDLALFSMQSTTRSWSATIRSATSRAAHDARVHEIIVSLNAAHSIYVVSPPTTETVWHDTNLAHDDEWSKR